MDGAKAFGPISIGDRTVIATSSVATQDLPADVWASGVPARVVKPRAAAAGHPT
jgi:acetyltransferase-like isoleucine patch superfamily enzyme